MMEKYERENILALMDALEAITGHFIAVLTGPIMRAAGVTFENGVENIPTIKAALNALAKAKGDRQ